MSMSSSLRTAPRPQSWSFRLSKTCQVTTRIIARLVLSSQHQPLTAHVRGVTAIGQIILRTPGYDIDMTIQVTKSHTSIMGQVLERATTNLLKDLEVRLMKDSKLIITTGSDSVGIFKFRDVPSGPLNIVVVIPQTTRRIFGAFSI